MALLVLAGCDRGERRRLKAEVARLHDENERLNAEAKRLLLQIADLKTALDKAEAEADDADADDEIPSAEEDLLRAAQDLYIHGEYHEAIATARRVVSTEPKAWRVIGASACFLHDRGGAKAAYAQVDNSGQQFIRYVCQRKGLSL
jgi:hypothetical protein